MDWTWINIGFFAIVIVPILLCLGTYLPHYGLQKTCIISAPFAALPALITAVYAPLNTTYEVPWLLLGVHIGFTNNSHIFLIFTAFLWFAAAIYAQFFVTGEETRPRFFTYFLLAMTGNFGAIVSIDILSFLSSFALMSFASYGLIVHRQNTESIYAAKVYMILVVIGEVCLFAGATLAAVLANDLTALSIQLAITESYFQSLIIGLLIAGFGIKAGLIPLHIWLPLAHPAAPTPASAVLSGAMIKIGLLGLIRFLPIGLGEFMPWGNLLIALGLFAIFFGVIIGLSQSNPKTVLAYSSISQMGFMTILLGIGLSTPKHADIFLVAITVYALHHGLAKGALFLSVGITVERFAKRWQVFLVSIGILFPALTLSALPWTSGALAKSTLKDAIYQSKLPSGDWIISLATVGAIGTALLMIRFIWIILPHQKTQNTSIRPGLWMSWILVVLASAVAPWIVPWPFLRQRAWESLIIQHQWQYLWPPLVAVAIAFIIGTILRKYPRLRPRDIPAGDIVYPLTLISRRLVRSMNIFIDRYEKRRKATLHTVTQNWDNYAYKRRAFFTHLEAILCRWQTGGILLIMICILMILSLQSP